APTSLLARQQRALPVGVALTTGARRTYMNISEYTARDGMNAEDATRFQNRVDQVLLSYLQEIQSTHPHRQQPASSAPAVHRLRTQQSLPSTHAHEVEYIYEVDQIAHEH
ncbi:hypothetical protein IWQ60_005125, partial [Tieghemiomyces parasiticus]